MRGHDWPHKIISLAIFMTTVISAEADYSTVASMLDNIARAGSTDVNFIAKFHQQLQHQVNHS